MSRGWERSVLRATLYASKGERGGIRAIRRIGIRRIARWLTLCCRWLESHRQLTLDPASHQVVGRSRLRWLSRRLCHIPGAHPHCLDPCLTPCLIPCPPLPPLPAPPLPNCNLIARRSPPQLPLFAGRPSKEALDHLSHCPRGEWHTFIQTAVDRGHLKWIEGSSVTVLLLDAQRFGEVSAGRIRDPRPCLTDASFLFIDEPIDPPLLSPPPSAPSLHAGAG